MKKLLYALVLVCFIFGGIVPAAADKVGYINLQRLVNESKMGKEAAAEIQKLRDQKEAAIAGKINALNALREDLNKNSTTMSQDEKKRKLDDLQQLYKEYQRMVADAKEDIAKEDKDLVAIIMQKADGILKKVAKKEKYTIILKDPAAIGYLDPDVDITDLVLKELNKR